MAKIYNPLSREQYGPLKGLVDFYYYKGQLCARKYPAHSKQPGTAIQHLTWQACRERWRDFRLLKDIDKQGYMTLSGNSQLSWVDVYSKSYMKGWAVRKKAPPIAYDVQFSRHAGQLRLCNRTTEDCVARVYIEIDNTGDKKKPWKWMFEQPSPPPPNCSIKWKIGYTFTSYVQIVLRGGSGLKCQSIRAFPKGQKLWVLIVITGGQSETVLFRTGAWYLVG